MKQRGFSLIELITVLVILAIVAAMGSHFMVSSTEAYIQTQARAKLVHRARQALERMARQLRGALPYSLRESNSGTCLEFLPVAAGANYVSDVPDQSNGASASASITTASFSVDFGTARYAAIGALGDTEIYASSPVSLAALNSDLALGTTASSVTLSAAKIWRRNSLQRRIFLLDHPLAFCVVGAELRVFEDFDSSFPLNSNVDPGSGGEVMAENVAADGDLFVIASGTEERNTKVTINLSFSEGGEQVSFSQEVSIRNVP